MEDKFYSFLRVYKKLPLTIQNSFGFVYRKIPRKIRNGKFYCEYQDRIQSFLNPFTQGEACEIQLELLQKTINSAIEQVPFYRNYPKLKEIRDLFNFPIVQKSFIVDNRDQFIAANSHRYRLKANTGGSSGTPMEFYIHSGRTRPKEMAHFDWFWGHYGYTPNSRILMLRGAALKNNAIFEYQAIKNCLAVSCYELNSKNVRTALKEIHKFQPEYIHGYPSSVLNFIRCTKNSNNTKWDISITALFLGSEGVLDADRKIIESFFNSKVISWYGHSECAIMGGRFCGSEEFCFFPFYGFTELLDDNYQPVTEPGASGRIVATSFDNFVMPFIRYDTGDIGVLSENKSFGEVPCIVLKDIVGRGQNYIYLNDLTRVSLTAFIFGQHLAQFSKINELQLEQKTAGNLLLRISKGNGYTNKDEIDIKNFLSDSVSGKLNIQFEYVDRIEKTHRGKHRFLIQCIED